LGDRTKTKRQLRDELERTRQRISELRAVEAELKESNELFQTLFYSSPIGIYIVQDGCFRIVGHQFAQITDYNEDELIGTPALDIVLPEDRDLVTENSTKMLRGERSLGYEFRIVTKRAMVKWVVETVALVYYQGGAGDLGQYHGHHRAEAG
jgi:PAS domain S-box-containing protein